MGPVLHSLLSDPLRLLIVSAGMASSLVVYVLMREPRLRREQFRGFKAWSVWASASVALAVLLLFLLAARLQGTLPG